MTVTEKPFNRSTDEVLHKIETLAKFEFLPIIGPNKGRFLVEEILKAKPKHVLEVGTLTGYSAILMGKELPEFAEIVTIEIHRDEAKQAEENINEANILPKIRIISGDALEVIPTLRGKFDFVFVDAEKSEYFQYIKLTEP